MMEGTYRDLLAKGRIYFGADNNSQPNEIRYLSEVEGIVPWTWWPHEEVGNTDKAKKEIYAILERDVDFDNPKPYTLLERIIQIATSPGDIILDSFAGSATTAHAALKLDRKFILIEMMDYAENITAERVRRVFDGYEATQKVRVFDTKITTRHLMNNNLYNLAQNAKEEARNKELNVKGAVHFDRFMEIVRGL